MYSSVIILGRPTGHSKYLCAKPALVKCIHRLAVAVQHPKVRQISAWVFPWSVNNTISNRCREDLGKPS
jgi:hypothetical protein